MRITQRLIFIVITLAFVGCASEMVEPDPDPNMRIEEPIRSGLDQLLRVGDLSVTDSRVLCEWQAETMDFAAGEILCADGRTVQLRSIEQCVQRDTATTCPQLTVGNVEECAIAASADPCMLFEAEECRPAMECPGRVQM